MARGSSLWLIGIGGPSGRRRGVVPAGRVSGHVRAAPPGASPAALPPAALLLPEPLRFEGRAAVHAWLLAREERLLEALVRFGGCLELRLRVREDPEAHAAWLRLADPGLAPGADAAPARAARREWVARRLAAIVDGEARAAMPHPAGGMGGGWVLAVPADSVGRLGAALIGEAARLACSGLHLTLSRPGPPRMLAAAALMDG